MSKKYRIALAGNPNCGKTCIFNALTGARQHVGNYPGVTVESKSGSFSLNDMEIELIDLPGVYSLSSSSIVYQLGSVLEIGTRMLQQIVSCNGGL